MKILITGGAGFIGSNLVRFLVHETPHEVVNVDKLTYAGNLGSLGDALHHPKHTFIQADISDLNATKQIFADERPDAVMHLAAESHVDRSIDSPGEFVTTNIVGTFNLLQCARGVYEAGDAEFRSRFRFLHVSTDEVYGSLAADQRPFHEQHRYEPHSPYSASKAASDHLARAWCDTFGLPVIVTNCSNNYGPYQFPEKLIPVVIIKALNREPIPVYGNGENIRDWLYVRDHALGLYAALTRGRPGETYNLGGDNECRNIDLVRTICGILDLVSPWNDGRKSHRYEELITFVKDRPGHDLRYAIDACKAKTELGWEPREDAASGLQRTVEWYVTNQDWWQTILSGDYRINRMGLGTRKLKAA